jgi:uncharacterized protein YehS (DUF1456 family)
MTIAEEVAEYLRYVLSINDSDAEKILAELNDNIHKVGI